MEHKLLLFILLLFVIYTGSITVVDKCAPENDLQHCRENSNYYNTDEERCCWVQKKLRAGSKTQNDTCILIEYTKVAIKRVEFILDETHTQILVDCLSKHIWSTSILIILALSLA